MSQRNAVLDAQAHEIVINHIERLGAERNVIAYILRNPDSVYDILISLNEQDFNNTINKIIYGHMVNLTNKGIAISHATLTAVLKNHSDVKPEDIDSYIGTISKTNTQNLDIKYNCELVKRASVKRQTYQEALNILLDCTSEEYSEGANVFLGRQEARLLDLSLKIDSIDNVEAFSETVDIFLEERAKNPKPIAGLQSNFAQMNQAIGGFEPGKLYVFAARAKTGKSALLTSICTHLSICSEEKVPTLYIDTEMKGTEVLSRILANLSGVKERDISNGMFSQSENDVEKVNRAKDLVESGLFYHVSMPQFDLAQLTSIIRKYYYSKGIRCVCFDYIKLPSSQSSNLQRDILLGKLTSGLKEMSSLLNIPILTACQLNRQGASAGADTDETMVRGSDEILFYANCLFLLRNKTDEEMESEGHELGNQVLTLAASRSGGDYIGWIDFEKNILRHKEIMNIA